jgi:hypothetical protein
MSMGITVLPPKKRWALPGPIPTLVGKFMPGHEVEVIRLEGERLASQLVKMLLPRLEAFRALKASPPELETGFELFDERTDVIVDPGNDVGWFDRLELAVKTLEPEQAQAFVELVKRSPGTEVLGSGDPDTRKKVEAYQRDFRETIGPMKGLSGLFKGAWKDDPAVVIAEAERVRPFVADLPKDFSDGELATRCRTALSAIRQEKKQSGTTLRRAMGPYAPSWATLAAFHEGAGHLLSEMAVINIPDQFTDVETAFRLQTEALIDGIADLGLPSVDILPAEPVHDLEAFDAFLAANDALPRYLGGVWINFQGYENPRHLLELARQYPRQNTLAAAHAWVFAGKSKLRSLDYALTARLLANRYQLDQLCDPSKGLSFLLTPGFGAQGTKALQGVGDVDTLTWSRRDVDILARKGFNVLTRTRQGLITAYQNQTRSDLEGYTELSNVRFHDNLLGKLQAFFEDEAPANFNIPPVRREFCERAHSLFVLPYERLKVGFSAKIEPADSDDPNELAVDENFRVPELIHRVSTVSRYQAAKAKTLEKEI